MRILNPKYRFHHQTRGKSRASFKRRPRSIRGDRWFDKQLSNAWKRVEARNSTKGKLLGDILHKEVWVWDGKEKQAPKWHLVVRREENSPEKRKYSLSDALSTTSTKKLSFMQAQRYWVERPFRDEKNQCGMGDYQVRGWIAWHYHMSMVMLAMLFLL